MESVKDYFHQPCHGSYYQYSRLQVTCQCKFSWFYYNFTNHFCGDLTHNQFAVLADKGLIYVNPLYIATT